VASSLGKGLTASSLGRLSKPRTPRDDAKARPYINVDPHDEPFQHGEVFVTDDKGETDLDLATTSASWMWRSPAGRTRHRLDLSIGAREGAQGAYLGETVQVIRTSQRDQGTNPRARERRRRRGDHRDRGTVGDIEILPFLEAIRQFRKDVGRDNVFYVHVTLVRSSGRRRSRRPSRPSTR